MMDQPNLLTRKLTMEEQHELLNGLYGFSYNNISDPGQPEHWVIFDEEGHEFYGTDTNCQFNFDTLAGIFSYQAYLSKNMGYNDCQRQMRKILGV